MYLARNGSHLLNKSSLLSCAPEYASLSKSRKKKKSTASASRADITNPEIATERSLLHCPYFRSHSPVCIPVLGYQRTGVFLRLSVASGGAELVAIGHPVSNFAKP